MNKTETRNSVNRSNILYTHTHTYVYIYIWVYGKISILSQLRDLKSGEIIVLPQHLENKIQVD
jgi:hypothetical protein